MLFFGYFSCLIVAFTVAAMWLIGSFNYSMVGKRHHPRPPIEAVTAAEIELVHLRGTLKRRRHLLEDLSPVGKWTLWPVLGITLGVPVAIVVVVLTGQDLASVMFNARNIILCC
jgi:hypothetical protein